MKKLYTTKEYKRWHRRRLLLQQNASKQKRKAKRYRRGNSERFFKNSKFLGVSDLIQNYDSVIAPIDLRLIENTNECLVFFRNLRSADVRSFNGVEDVIDLKMDFVEQIDYGAISVLTAISDDLASKNIILKGNFPKNSRCKQIIIDSGFLEHMFNGKTGKKYQSAPKSKIIIFEKGEGILSVSDNQTISKTVKSVVEHLTGELNQCLAVKTVILEICGNSIEWAQTDNKQWLLGVQYEENNVVFTLTDVGRGILGTLYRKFIFKATELFLADHKILEGAFDKKYGSSSQEVNRNKGLPSIKQNFERQVIRNLKVLTNNVLLHFDNPSRTKTFKKGEARFKGTYYQWEMDRSCFEKLLKKEV